MKKLILCGLAVVMILSLAACGDNSGNKNDDQSGKQTQTGLKQGGHGVPELVPEWVDGQKYPQGEDEPVDDGTNVPSDENQKEEPVQHNIG